MYCCYCIYAIAASCSSEVLLPLLVHVLLQLLTQVLLKLLLLLRQHLLLVTALLQRLLHTFSALTTTACPAVTETPCCWNDVHSGALRAGVAGPQPFMPIAALTPVTQCWELFVRLRFWRAQPSLFGCMGREAVSSPSVFRS